MRNIMKNVLILGAGVRGADAAVEELMQAVDAEVAAHALP